MRVVYSIGARFAGGGIGTTAYHAVRGLHRRGLLARLLCGSYVPSDIPSDRIRAMGLPSRLLRKLAAHDPSRRAPYWHNRLYDGWSRRHLPGCDVFHGWNNHCRSTLVRAKSDGAVCLVERASSHPAHYAALMGDEHRRWGLSWKMPEAALSRAEAELDAADHVLVPSPFVRDTFLERGFAPDRLIEIPFGTDVERFRPPAAREANPFRVLFVGEVGVNKGILYLLEAWDRLRWRDAELWVAGRTAPGFEKVLRPFRASSGVRWLGFASDTTSLYRAAHAFAFPSLQEGSALVTYEALASGLPVVTTYESGSVVRDGREGFLVPIRDAEALADRLERLRTDPSRWEEMSRAARDRALAFRWTRYGDELAAAVRRLLP